MPNQGPSHHHPSDLYRSITETIIAAIEKGAGKFVMPWHGGGVSRGRPINAVTKARYQGVNTIALWAEATLLAYPTGEWASYRQWASVGGQVRRGEHGALIVFYKSLPPTDETSDPEASSRNRRGFARGSHVFNAAQIEGWQAPEQPRVDPVETREQIESAVQRLGVSIEEGGDIACYVRSTDSIRMPARERFTGTPTSTPTEAYYATLLHELTHWTGASHRLDRQFGERFGDPDYAFEELVAELGAAFLCADFAVSNAPRPDHAAYLQGWLHILQADAKAIFKAARLAQAATTYLTASAEA